jgi:hypothetical protein
MARGRLAETVLMIVRADQLRLSDQCDTRFFRNLADRCCFELLIWMDTACRHLGARLRMVSVLEDQQISSPFDVDHHSLTALHLP